jgi:hypothetical protein
VEFGHHDLLTSRHPNYFYRDFSNKEPTAIHHGDRAAVVGTDLQTVQKVATGTVKMLNASLQEGGWTIPASAVITYCHSFISLKNKNKKLLDII